MHLFICVCMALLMYACFGNGSFSYGSFDKMALLRFLVCVALLGSSKVWFIDTRLSSNVFFSTVFYKICSVYW